MILFTDFDGVCHPAYHRSELPDEENRPFSYLPRLENVLRDYPEVRIVISSSWRQYQPWENIIKPFAPDILSRIIGATPVLVHKEPPYPKHPRYLEIIEYLHCNDLKAEKWIALDDEAELYPLGCETLILCRNGFRDAEEEKLRTLLCRQRESKPT